MAKKQFKAESKRLLDLMINSIYTHKEIFLREIISNASDAIDKLCYLSLTDDKVGLSREDFKIDIKIDKEHRLLTVSDNGIGMSKEELESNLGTIAHSGSLQFKQELDQEEAGKEPIDIIGQFGVGFYSAFMVSEAITVISRKYGSDEAYMWQSSGADGYIITPCEKDAAGTEIIMKIKADTEEESYSEFLEPYRLRSLVKKYSDYIRYPIKMDVEHQRKKEGQEDQENPEYETVVENETLNSMIPIWQQNKSKVKPEEYNDFYKEKFFDYEDPLNVIHVSAEGRISYKALLFIPAKTPYDYYTKEYEKGLQLYSSGVLIMDRCADLLPEHFRFVRGVVDSQDLSLNISRELLQHDRQLKIIASNIEKKIKSELLKMLNEDREKYEAFYKAFGLQLKYGVVGEYGANKDLLKDLLMFYSSTEGKMVTLSEYVGRMKEGQENIYYAAGESVAKIEQLPQTEIIREKGYEMLYFLDEVDEFVAQILMSFEEKNFKNINSDDLGLETEEEKAEIEKNAEENKDLLAFVKETLGDKVKDVRLSKKLRSHPVCLVPEGSLSFEMEKYLNQVQPDGKLKADRVLELNASHPIFERLKQSFETDPDAAKKYAELLYCQGLLIADLPLEDPSAYTDLVCSLIQ